MLNSLYIMLGLVSNNFYILSSVFCLQKK
jgi:hypothetical protein